MNTFGEIFLNWRVLTALTLIGISIWLVAPNAVTILLLLILVAACPLTLLGMIISKGRSKQKKQQQPRREGLPPDEQIASLKAQLIADKAQSQGPEKDFLTSNDQWIKL